MPAPTRCSVCGRFTPAFHTDCLADGRDVCGPCMRDDSVVFECHFCGDTDTVDDQGGERQGWKSARNPDYNPDERYSRTWISVQTTERWCQSCEDTMVTCNDCDERIHEDDSYSVNGSTLCESCRDNWYTCNDCGEYVHGDDVRYDEYGDGTYCSGCYRDGSGGQVEPEHMVRCQECQGHNTFLNLDTEKYVCECEADRLAKQGVAIQRPAGTPPLSLPENLPVAA